MDGGETGSDPGKRTERSERQRGNRSPLPPDAPEPDVLEQTRDWRGEGDKRRSRIPIDAPEADVVDDLQEEGDERPSRVPIDAPEADVLDQARPADLDDDDREHD